MIKYIYKVLVTRPLYKLKARNNKKGNGKKCYICKNSFNYFLKYKEGSKSLPEFHRKLDSVGSDVDNFRCPFCNSHDRERHLFMFFDKIKLWDQFEGSSILHFAPEKHLTLKIKSLNPSLYVKADYSPTDESIEKVDATKIPYDDKTFDFVLCNHVLEHIVNYKMAIEEIHRVLKPRGVAILQTPFSKLLKRNFEEEKINNDELRLFFYGEKDHFRIFSEENLLNDLDKAGFEIDIVKHSDNFDGEITRIHGVNQKEDLLRVRKTSTNP